MKRILTIVILAVAAFAAGVIAQGNEPEPTFTIPIYEEHPRMWTDLGFLVEQAVARNAFIHNNPDQNILPWLYRNNWFEGKEVDYEVTYYSSTPYTAQAAQASVQRKKVDASRVKRKEVVRLIFDDLQHERNYANHMVEVDAFAAISGKGGYRITCDANKDRSTTMGNWFALEAFLPGTDQRFEPDGMPGKPQKKSSNKGHRFNMFDRLRVKGKVVRIVQSVSGVKVYVIATSITAAR
jgi:hypothetical protein